MFWISKNRKYWGWMDRTPRGGLSLELSLHSRLKLARENMGRLVTDEIRKYMVKED